MFDYSIDSSILSVFCCSFYSYIFLLLLNPSLRSTSLKYYLYFLDIFSSLALRASLCTTCFSNFTTTWLLALDAFLALVLGFIDFAVWGLYFTAYFYFIVLFDFLAGYLTYFFTSTYGYSSINWSDRRYTLGVG